MLQAVSTDWWLEGAKIGIPAVLAFLGGMSPEKFKKHQTRNLRAAAYLETIAGAL